MSYLGNISLHNVQELKMNKVQREEYMVIEITVSDNEGNIHVVQMFGSDIKLVLAGEVCT